MAKDEPNGATRSPGTTMSSPHRPAGTRATGAPSPPVQPLLFVGGLFDDRQRELVEASSQGTTQAAADVLQWGFVEGLQAIPQTSLTILSAPFVGSYPKRFKHALVETRTFEHGESERHKQVGFLNLPLLKHLSRAVAVSRHARRWALDQQQGGIAIGYSLSFDIVWSLAEARRVNPQLIVAVIVPDLPEFMNTGMTTPIGYRILKAAESRLVRQLLMRIDAMVLLTESMAARLPSRPHIVIEGVGPRLGTPDPQEASTPPTELMHLGEKKTIVYAGTTNTRYGVVELCRAFRQVGGPDLALVICGAGDGAAAIESQAEKDPRIHYLGQLPRSTVLKLERAATLLVNPRSSREDFSRYSFPSKILEYMSAGVPILCYKLGGIPTEYDSYLTYIPGDTIDDFAAAMKSVLGLPPETLKENGEAAKRFVETDKNSDVQARKLIDFLRTIARTDERRPATSKTVT